MDLLLSFFFLIISSVIGITMGLLLGMTSYLKLAIIVICIFILFDVFYEYIYSNNSHYTNTTKSNSILTKNPNVPNTTIPIATDMNIKNTTKTEKIKYASLENTDVFSNDKSPFDELDPTELLTRLNYIYYATANPLTPINYSSYKTHADKLLDEPESSNSKDTNSNMNENYKLSTNDPKLLKYSQKYYPQLTDNQIDAKDCLNYGSGKSSCFQNPSLFFNIKNDFNILTKGVNENNSNLVVREDFSNPPTNMNMSMNPNTRYDKPLFENAPNFKLDKPLDQQSNETIDLDTTQSKCRNCKLAICSDDYCSLQNQLFM